MIDIYNRYLSSKYRTHENQNISKNVIDSVEKKIAFFASERVRYLIFSYLFLSFMSLIGETYLGALLIGGTYLVTLLIGGTYRLDTYFSPIAFSENVRPKIALGQSMPASFVSYRSKFVFVSSIMECHIRTASTGGGFIVPASFKHATTAMICCTKSMTSIQSFTRMDAIVCHSPLSAIPHCLSYPIVCHTPLSPMPPAPVVVFWENADVLPLQVTQFH